MGRKKKLIEDLKPIKRYEQAHVYVHPPLKKAIDDMAKKLGFRNVSHIVRILVRMGVDAYWQYGLSVLDDIREGDTNEQP